MQGEERQGINRAEDDSANQQQQKLTLMCFVVLAGGKITVTFVNNTGGTNHILWHPVHFN